MIIFALFLFLSLIHAQPCFEWYKNHQRCLFCAQSSIDSSTSSVQGEGQCEDAAYLGYFKKILDQPPSEYHKEVAENVLNLYADLVELRKPAVLRNEEVPRGKPNAIDSLKYHFHSLYHFYFVFRRFSNERAKISSLYCFFAKEYHILPIIKHFPHILWDSYPGHRATSSRKK